jgi:hypothetical protein
MAEKRDHVEYDEEAGPNGPIPNPVNRFGHLPEPTRRWLESLREDDIKEMIDGVKMSRAIKSWGRITKWLIVTFVAIFLGIVGFGEGILRVWGWINHGGPR